MNILPIDSGISAHDLQCDFCSQESTKMVLQPYIWDILEHTALCFNSLCDTTFNVYTRATRQKETGKKNPPNSF